MREKNHITRARLIIRSLFFTVVTATVIFAEEQKQSIPVDPKLVALNKIRPVLKTVKKFYPEASSILFMQNLHFEDSTQNWLLRRRRAKYLLWSNTETYSRSIQVV